MKRATDYIFDARLYIDGSLLIRDAEIAQLDASIIRIDASLGIGTVSKEYVDGSIELQLMPLIQV